MRFSGLFQFQAIFGYFLLFLDIQIQLYKTCTKFPVKQAKILPSKGTSCCCTANQYCEIACIFSKEREYDERTFFWGSPRSLDLSYNSQPQKHAYLCFYALYNFLAFFVYFLLFLEIQTKLIKRCSKFQVKRGKVLRS